MNLTHFLKSYISIARSCGVLPFEIQPFNNLSLFKISKKFLKYGWVYFIICNAIFFIELFVLIQDFILNTENFTLIKCLRILRHLLFWLSCETLAWANLKHASLLCNLWNKINSAYLILNELLDRPVDLKPMKIIVLFFTSFPLLTFLFQIVLQTNSSWGAYLYTLLSLPSLLIFCLHLSEFLIHRCVIYYLYYTINSILKEKRKIISEISCENNRLQILIICDEILKDLVDIINDLFSQPQLWFVAQTFLSLYVVVLQFVMNEEIGGQNLIYIYLCVFHVFYLWLFCAGCAYPKREVKNILNNLNFLFF